MADESYSGWKNWETWNTALWLDNDQGLQESVLELASGAFGSTKKSQARNYGDLIEGFFREVFLEPLDDNPEISNAGPISDFINMSVAQIDWIEIAEHYMDQLEEEEEEEEDE